VAEPLGAYHRVGEPAAGLVDVDDHLARHESIGEGDQTIGERQNPGRTISEPVWNFSLPPRVLAFMASRFDLVCPRAGPTAAAPFHSSNSHDTSVLRRGSASHSRDKVNRNILTIKSAAFLKKIGNGPGQFAYKLIDSLCFDIEPCKATGFNVPKINLRIVSDINGDRRFHHLGMLLRRAHTRSKINIPSSAFSWFES
jgi:hypothetical protein